MAHPEDSIIAKSLRRVVREAAKKDEVITVKAARTRVEKELGLEEGFLHRADEWRARSKSVIQAAFDEDSEPEIEPAPAVQPAPKTPISKPSSVDKESATKVPNSQNRASKATASRGSNGKLSQERVEEDSGSDAEADTSEAAEKKTKQPKQVNGVKRKADEQASSSEESESESESSSDTSDSQASPKKKARKEESSSSGEDNDSSSEDSSDGKDSSKRSGAVEDGPTKLSTPVNAIPARTFVPPSGFTPISSELLANNAHLDAASLEGKQIWHIAAPATLSLSTITELSMDAIRSGQVIHTHNGIEYVLSEQDKPNDDASSILLATNDGYKSVSQRIERALHLQQKISLPSLTIRQADQNAGSSAAAEVSATHISKPRPQPTGLRMRFKPPGSDPGRPGIVGSGSDSEDGVVDVHAQTGLTQDVDRMVVDDEASDEPAKKAKKRRKSKDVEETEETAVNGVAPKSSAKKTPSVQPSVPNGVPQETPSKEDRKKSKRERKEAKQKSNG